HGSGGLDWGRILFEQHAKMLARRGHIACILHYFQSTETEKSDKNISELNFPVWLTTISEAITFISKEPKVDPNRIGLIGFSLGAFLALALATIDTRIKAVVDVFGGLPPTQQITALPPTLILHGAADEIVPVEEAYKLETVLKTKNLPYKISIYPDQGHQFIGKSGKDALLKTLSFLDEVLK
ncbi:MAG: dienelactone hydrolase family protein, partial [Blastocatellia bacterium]|nr:dienelactone hydrolase family protein [Blastocatellia bacterium]